jgi:hypothetical protein
MRASSPRVKATAMETVIDILAEGTSTTNTPVERDDSK